MLLRLPRLRVRADGDAALAGGGICSADQRSRYRYPASQPTKRRTRGDDAAGRRQFAGDVVDHAGGYGILVRLLRDAGVDARWRDKYCENLLARGFEATDEPCDLLTAFEVLEHLVDPVRDLSRMLHEAPAVLASTELIMTAQTPPPGWWYYGPEHGQHVGFFRRSTDDRTRASSSI